MEDIPLADDLYVLGPDPITLKEVEEVFGDHTEITDDIEAHADLLAMCDPKGGEDE